MTPCEILETAMDLGEQMLLCGAEVARVEDSIMRVCQAYEAERADVFSITSSLYVTLRKDGQTLTQTRRVPDYAVNLHRLDLLNNLSREICRRKPDRSYVERELVRIVAEPLWKLPVICVSSAVIAAAFVILFDGTIADAAVAGVLGVLLRLCLYGLQRLHANMIFTNVVASFFIGAAAMLAVRCGIGQQLDKIIIGNIMLLIPGLLLVNAVRDLVARDIMTGMLRLCEAIVLSVAIAIGFWVAALLMGGLL